MCDMIFSTVVVMLMTWFPAWVSREKRGLSFLTKYVFSTASALSFVYYVLYLGVEPLKGVGGSFLIALFSVIVAWFVYFCYESFISKGDD